MVLRLLPSPGSGGPLRRFLTLRQRLYRDAWHDDRPHPGPLPLFDFRNNDDASDVGASIKSTRRTMFPGWRVSDDSVIGGYSTSHMDLIRPTNDDNSSSVNSVPFLRWSGNISTQINRSNIKSRHITRSGFAAIMTPEYPLGAPLGSRYKALEICCRTDGRTYAVNLHVETYFPGDVYQGFIGEEGVVAAVNDTAVSIANRSNDHHQLVYNQHNSTTIIEEEEDKPSQSLDVREYISSRYKRLYKIDPSTNPLSGFPPSGFTRLIMPFADFTLTSRGRARMEQRYLDGAVTLESIGFTLMDGQDGDFTFDLVSVRAVNVLEGEVVGTLEDERREEEMRRQFMQEAGKG